MSAIRTLLLSAVLGLSLSSAASFGADGLRLERRTSLVGSVAVSVRPLNVAPGAESWDFEIDMVAHTEPLEEDLTKAAVLIDDIGVRHPPSAWKGDPPGGHRRQGVLQFMPLAGRPAYFELQIRPEETADVRTFRWQLR